MVFSEINLYTCKFTGDVLPHRFCIELQQTLKSVQAILSLFSILGVVLQMVLLIITL